MGLTQIVALGQRIDKRLTRWRSPHKRSMLINARTPMNYVVMAPVYKAMRDDPRVSFYFMSGERPSEEVYREANGSLRLISPRRAALKKFDAYVAADFIWAPLPRGVPRIQMFHGVAGKYANIYDRPDHSMRDWHRLFFINRRRMGNFISSGAIDGDSPRARLVGMPKLDCLVDGSLKREDVLASLDIEPARSTVLYAPTWSPYSSLNAMGEELVALLAAAGYVVIVKLHDRSRDPEYIHSGGIDWAARLEPTLVRSGGRLVSGSDSSPYLAAADVLITDHSSIGFEYMLLDRPVIRIEMPDLIAKTNVNPEYVELLAAASTSVRDAKEAVEAVERNLAEPQSQSASRRAVAEELFYKPGTATARAVRELYEVLELDSLQAV
ncbi:MAG TPA: CDP-glycerol glycerophosphotransferase family protein [Blastocatellia bacterium]|nr:CDP-glycerol glycerophosphotransferase family protein [Blastocatellia bacterium]